MQSVNNCNGIALGQSAIANPLAVMVNINRPTSACFVIFVKFILL
jgi:hypothetical protein